MDVALGGKQDAAHRKVVHLLSPGGTQDGRDLDRLRKPRLELALHRERLINPRPGEPYLEGRLVVVVDRDRIKPEPARDHQRDVPGEQASKVIDSQLDELALLADARDREAREALPVTIVVRAERVIDAVGPLPKIVDAGIASVLFEAADPIHQRAAVGRGEVGGFALVGREVFAAEAGFSDRVAVRHYSPPKVKAERSVLAALEVGCFTSGEMKWVDSERP